MTITEYLKENYDSVSWDDDMKVIILNGEVVTNDELNELAGKVKSSCGYGKLPEKEVIKAINRCAKDWKKKEEKESKHPGNVQIADWMNGMDLSDKGAVLDSAKNNRLLYEQHPGFKGKFTYDDIRQEELYDGMSLNDVIQANIKVHTEEILGGNRSKINVKDAILVACNSHHVNPLRDKLKSLRGMWDGEERLDGLFIKAFECDDTPYIREVTKQLFYAWLNRIYNPGCTFNMIFMFEGKQGIGKSELLLRMLRLIGGRGVDGMKFNDNRSTLEKIASHQLCLFDELGNMSKADLEFIKEFISRSSDTFDKKYRDVKTAPRSCILVGNLNPDRKGFLKDVTLNFERRFIIIPCHAKGTEEMPVKSESWWWEQFLPDEYLMQVWAEAVYKVENEPDFNWMGWTKDRIEAAKAIQKDYSSLQNDDILINELQELLDLKYVDKNYYKYDDFVKAVENAKNQVLIKGEDLHQIKCSVLRQYIKINLHEDRSYEYFTALMKRLGWEKIQTSYRDRSKLNVGRNMRVDVYRRIQKQNEQEELL